MTKKLVLQKMKFENSFQKSTKTENEKTHPQFKVYTTGIYSKTHHKKSLFHTLVTNFGCFEIGR